MEIFATLFGGLGLFFVGVKLIGRNLQHMAGRRVRAIMARATGHPVPAAFAGTVLGVLTQSTNAATFIVINLITAGVIGVRAALPLVGWANLGTSALVLLTVLDLRLAVLWLLGATGMCFYFDLDKSARWRHLIGALLGLGTLFLGLQLMKTGALPLRDVLWVQSALRFAASSDALLLLIGAVITMVAQSSATVSMLAVTMAMAGLMGEHQTVMVVLGASLGSGLTTFLMAGNLEGTARQFGLFQILFKAVGVAILLPLLEAEAWTGRPMLLHLLEHMVDDVPERVAWVFLLCQIVPALLFLPFYGALERFLARLAPPSKAEEVARPHYLFDQALMDAESALPLVEKEQARLLRLLPDALDGVRAEPETATPIPSRVLHEAVTSVARAVDSFQTELLDGALPREELERGIRLKTRLEVLAALNDGVFELAELIGGSPADARAHPLTGNMVESLHALLLTLAEAAEDPDPDGTGLLLTIAGDRGELMERIRAALMRADPGLPAAVQQALFAETTLFERLVWLIRRYALLLRGPDDTVAEPAALAAAAD